jgi:ribosome-binding protein aMBF1 (putative translation factor)
VEAETKRAPKRTQYDLAAVFAENVEREMEARGWSWGEFSRKTGLERRTLRDICSVRYTATLSSVEKIASAFHIPPHLLLVPRGRAWRQHAR